MYFSVKYIAIWTVCTICTTSAVTFEQKSYFALERPHVSYVNPKYLSALNMTSRRYSRHDSTPYFNFHAETLIYWDDNVTYHIYFLEFLSNQYKYSFVELHLKACDLINTNPITSKVLKEILKQPCPLPPSAFDFYNFTINFPVVKNFPFRRGRILVNVTYGYGKRERICEVFADFQLKQIKEKQ